MNKLIFNPTPLVSLQVWHLAIIFLVCYFIGNISFSRIIVGKDVVNSGTKNPGATNSFRVGGVKKGIAVGLSDAFKSMVPAFIALIVFGRFACYIASIAVVIGHVFPVVYKFKGGKGMACTIGQFAAFQPVIVFIVFFTFVGVLILTRTSSISTLGSTTTLLLIEAIFINIYYKEIPLEVYQLVIANICLLVNWGLLLYTHRGNIHRLFTGKENKLNFKKKKQEQEKVGK